MEKYQSIWDGRNGRILVVKHRINLICEETRPINALPYQAGPGRRNLKKTELNYMLKGGIAAPATTEWASAIVLAPKKDGTPRFCVGYRHFNAKTIRDSYLNPGMNECMN